MGLRERSGLGFLPEGLVPILASVLVATWLFGCQTSAPRGSVQELAAVVQPPGPMYLKVPAQPKSWSVTPIRDGLFASTSHVGGVLEVWRLAEGRGLHHLMSDPGVGFHPDAVRVADWDGDGRPDLLVAAEGINEVQWWSAQGGGRYAKKGGYRLPYPPRDLAAADLDGDGRPDLVVGPYAGKHVSFLFGRGGFDFERMDVVADKTPSHPVILDWDRDGDLDVIWPEWDGGGIRLARNQGQRHFTLEYLAPPTYGLSPRQLAVADLDADGWPDLVAALETAKAARIYYNDAGKGIRQTEDIPAPVWGYSWVAVQGEGDDALIALSEEGRIVLARRATHGAWSLRQVPAGSLPLDLHFVDLDHDGEQDLLFANSAGPGLGILFGPLWSQAGEVK